MVFLFPGVLFRKFYFSGKFGNQFEQGNILERFLWSLFLSIICLSGVAFIFFLFDYYFGIKPLENVNFKELTKIFQDLAKNEFPKSFIEEKSFLNFLFLLVIIYLISVVLGFCTKSFVLIFSIDKLSAFKFKNSWHYLSQPYKENGVHRKIGDVHTTFADILAKNNSKEELYSGILKDIILDKDDKLENVVLSNVYKFVTVEITNQDKIDSIQKSIDDCENIFTLHRDYSDKKVFKKSIDGNLLILSKENIININLTYINTSNKVAIYKGYFYNFIRGLFVLNILFLVTLPFLELDLPFLKSIHKKIFFSISTFLLLVFVNNLILRILRIKIFASKLIFKDVFFILLLLLSPYLWILDYFNVTVTLIVVVVIILIYSYFNGKNKTNN